LLVTNISMDWGHGMSNGRLRLLLQQPGVLVVPGSFDMISAKVIDGLGFPALITGGYGHSASHLGMPDAGLITLPEMVERVRNTVRTVSIPVIADGDTGFGGLINVVRTVREYEHAGASAVQMEDQQMPKKCGHTPGREVVDAEEMCLKIRAAVEARRSPDFLVFARTDARTTLGLDEAIRRGRLYQAAGADALFVESPESEDEFAQIGRELAGMPLIANMVVTGRGPLLSVKRLQELGFKIVLYPTLTFLAAIPAMREALAAVWEDGTPTRVMDRLMTMDECHQFVGFPEVWSFEERYGLKDYSTLGSMDAQPDEPKRG